MKQQEEYRSIAELWAELSGHLDIVQDRDEFLAQPTEGDYDPYREAAAKDIVWREGKIERLRAELLERCRPLLEGKETAQAMESLLVTEGIDPLDAIAGLKLFSAAFGFLAYDLEQRDNEAQKGGEQV